LEVKDNQVGDQSRVPYVEDLPAGLSPSTTWDIASLNIAAAIAYAKTVQADREAAEELGREPEEPIPFQSTWPGKPLEDVFAYGVFINVTTGVEDTLPFPSCCLGTLGGQPSALHLQLVLELLLLCWPDPQAPDSKVTSADQEVFPNEHMANFRWDWLLLIIALLQQTSTKQKQQLLQERGPLLMQLLYQALLEDEGLGGAGSRGLVTANTDMAWLLWYMLVTQHAQLEHWLKGWGIQWAASVPMAVTMVLQSLLFEALPEFLVDPETARIGKVTIDSSSKCGTWDSLGTMCYKLCTLQQGIVVLQGTSVFRGH
jgi:hypothetical protein